MNWEEVGAIGQVLGSVAVFVTLVYLAIQTRRARSESQRALSQGRAESIRDINSLLMDGRVSSVWLKSMIALEAPVNPLAVALMERAKLTQEEAWLVAIMARTLWGNIITTMRNVDELTPIERSEFKNAIRMHYGVNGPSRIFYESHKATAHPDAIRYIENVLVERAVSAS